MRKTVLILSACVALFAASAVAQEPPRESTYERVMRTGVIRCGYAVWPPVLYVEPNTSAVKGIAHDMMEEMGKRLSLKIKWVEESSFGTIVQGLAGGRYDMICTGLYKNGARARRIAYSAPFVYTPLHIAVRKDETEIASVKDLEKPGIRIALLEGEAGSNFARKHYPDARFIAIPQNAEASQLFENVADGKADVTFPNLTYFANFEKKNPGKLKILDPGHPSTVFPTALGLPQGDTALASMIDGALSEIMSEGMIESLLKKYDVKPGALLPAARPYELPAKE
jgi:polar amino acid transport system substrate-binding protein